ncbi:MAG: V-type ATP synthase subunit K [Desulfurococcales archaeon]|nr:V-type ATP synthase subunit K [Desulfurococcales archaeon]
MGSRKVAAYAFLLAAMLLPAAALVAYAQEDETIGGGIREGLKLVGAGLAVGLAGIGGGYAVGVAGAAAISAVSEKREMQGIALLYVVLGEGIAIYGLLVSLLILFVI